MPGINHTCYFPFFFLSFFSPIYACRMNDIQDKYGEKPRKEKGFVETIMLVFFFSFKKGGLINS